MMVMMILIVIFRYYADMEKQVCDKQSSKNHSDITHPDACFNWRRFAKYDQLTSYVFHSSVLLL